MGKAGKLFLVSASALLLLFGIKVFFGVICSGSFRQSDQPLVNPLMGFAPMADSSKGDSTSLVYIGLTWREIEPEPGIYDWETFEEEYRKQNNEDASFF